MNIAVAIDGSNNALRAAEHAIAFARYIPDTTIDLIFVIDFSKTKDEYLLTQSLESLNLERKQKIDQVVQLTADAQIPTKITQLKGDPGETITQYVNDQAIDLLVMGCRGRSPLQGIILGSVSQAVMKHVQCPVTIVK